MKLEEIGLPFGVCGCVPMRVFPTALRCQQTCGIGCKTPPPTALAATLPRTCQLRSLTTFTCSTARGIDPTRFLKRQVSARRTTDEPHRSDLSTSTFNIVRAYGNENS